MTYIVVEPKRVGCNAVKPDPVLVTEDIETAKKLAKKTKNYFLSKGWESWAKKIAICAPKNAEGFNQFADQINEYWKALDAFSNGNSLQVEPLRDMEKALRARAI